MEPELIEKEKNYRRLNTELEQKTKDLMQEVETIMEKLNECGRDNESKQNNIQLEEKWSKDTKKNIETLQGFNRNVKQEIICKSDTLNKIVNEDLGKETPNNASVFQSVTNCIRNNLDNNVTFFLQSKVNILLNELQEVKTLYLEKVKEYTNLQSSYRRLEKEVKNIKQLHFKMKESEINLEKKITLTSNKLKDVKAENKSLKNEIETLKTTLDDVKRKDTMQLKFLLEETERLNKIVAKKIENENSMKSLNEDELLKKHKVDHKAEMVILLKKQLQLLSNLKKQQHLIETKKPLKLGERAFLKVFTFDS